MKLSRLLIGLFAVGLLNAQETNDSNNVEEVVVVGTQIKGAKITGALPVNLVSAEDIAAIAADDGEDLFSNIAEQGINNYNQTDFNGGYNASRGDVGSINLRNIGTGNTLSLLNGRRLVNSPGYQTENIGGSFVPVLTANTNSIPVFGADRIEILRDGASAIYGADAVAGVVNTVLKTDYEGASIRYRAQAYDHFASENHRLNMTWGKNFGATNVSVYFDYYDRGKISALEDPKWSLGDLRSLLPADSTYNDTTWRNLSSSSQWGQFYVGNGSNRFTMYRATDSNCTKNDPSNQYTIPGADYFCFHDSSSTRTESRKNYADDGYQKRGDLERINFFMFVNTELDNGVEAYTEFGVYTSEADRVLYAGTMLGLGSSAIRGGNTQPMLIPSTNYYLNQLQRADGSKFVDKEDDFLWVRFFRFMTPRSYDSQRFTYRLVQGFRGDWNNWDWDSAIVISEGKSRMMNHGRANLTLLDAALAKSTPDAYNPFCAGIADCNEEQFMTSIYRKNTSKLTLVDFKLSNPEVFQMPAGPVGMLLGAEIREESLDDMRDPNINGTIRWTGGAGFPYVSNIANSSPSPDTFGERTTTSLFAEAQIPLMENMNSQLAIRYEDADDFGDNVVGKFALGWDLHERVMFRASTSTSFRAPNLVTVNEGLIARNNTREDALLAYAAPDFDSDYSMQRVAQGNADLQAEEATNTSLGFVLRPLDGLIVTIDKWEIEQEDTVGLFGEENHILLDLLIRLQGGPSECTGNPLVVRNSFVLDDDPTSDTYTGNWNENLCKTGTVERVNDTYINLDNRTLKGTDVIIDYMVDTDWGEFSAKYVSTSYDDFYQEASGAALQIINAAKSGGPLDVPGVTPPSGFQDLLGKNGFFEDKQTLRLSWKNGPYSVLVSGTSWSDFEETGVTNNANGGDGNSFWVIDAMKTYNLTMRYQFDNGIRLSGTIHNVEDTRSPRADEFVCAAGNDVHNDYGRYYTLEICKRF